MAVDDSVIMQRQVPAGLRSCLCNCGLQRRPGDEFNDKLMMILTRGVSPYFYGIFSHSVQMDVECRGDSLAPSGVLGSPCLPTVVGRRGLRGGGDAGS